MSKLLSILIAAAFAATMSFNAVAAKHMAPAPAADTAKPADAAKPAKKKHKKAKTKKAEKEEMKADAPAAK